MNNHLAISFGVSLLVSAGASADLMIADSGIGDRIMLFSDIDGSLIDVNWITDAGAVGWAFTTPKEAVVVGNEIWVPDQVTDGIHRFDMNRVYLSSVTALPGGGVLDNMRGIGTDGTNVYVTVFHGTAALRGIAVYTIAGAPVTLLANRGDRFDVEAYGGNLLISNDTTDSIERWTTAGVLLNNFAIGVVFPQQVISLPDGSVISVSSISTAGVEGVYHHNADGTLLRFIDTEILKVAFGETVPRGAYPLGDGNYIVAANTGVFKYLVASNSFTLILSGVSAQYVNPIDLSPPCVPDIAPPGGNDFVNVDDLLLVINSWGPCPGCPADIVPPGGDGFVNVDDLLAVINGWGQCPP